MIILTLLDNTSSRLPLVALLPRSDKDRILADVTFRAFLIGAGVFGSDTFGIEGSVSSGASAQVGLKING